MANRGNSVDARLFGCDPTSPVKACGEVETCRGQGRGHWMSRFQLRKLGGMLSTPRCGVAAPLTDGRCFACLEAEAERERRLSEFEAEEYKTARDYEWEEFAESEERDFNRRMVAKYGSMEAFENEVAEMYYLGSISGLS